ncbi:MAG: hypothetical protein U0Y10_09880 [Spirosomataceae bacterium]
MQVISSPNAQAGATPSSVCLGSTINLTSSGGSSYSWNGPNNFSNNTQNPSPFSAISTNQGGIYSVSVTVGSCTASATTSVEVKVSPTAVAGTSTPIVCVGGAITLTSSGGSSYSWNGPTTLAITPKPQPLSVPLAPIKEASIASASPRPTAARPVRPPVCKSYQVPTPKPEQHLAVSA